MLIFFFRKFAEPKDLTISVRIVNFDFFDPGYKMIDQNLKSGRNNIFSGSNGAMTPITH